MTTAHLLTHLLPASSTKLGRLTTSAHRPDQNFHDPLPPRPDATETHTAHHTDFRETRTFTKRSRLNVGPADTAPQTTTSDLQNSDAWLTEACGQEATQQWMQAAAKRGDSVYLVVGIRSACNATLTSERAGGQWGGEGEVGMKAAAAAAGEMVYAVLYREVRLRTVFAKSVEGVALEGGCRWREVSDGDDVDPDSVGGLGAPEEEDVQNRPEHIGGGLTPARVSALFNSDTLKSVPDQEDREGSRPAIPEHEPSSSLPRQHEDIHTLWPPGPPPPPAPPLPPPLDSEPLVTTQFICRLPVPVLPPGLKEAMRAYALSRGSAIPEQPSSSLSRQDEDMDPVGHMHWPPGPPPPPAPPLPPPPAPYLQDKADAVHWEALWEASLGDEEQWHVPEDGEEEDDEAFLFPDM